MQVRKFLYLNADAGAGGGGAGAGAGGDGGGGDAGKGASAGGGQGAGASALAGQPVPLHERIPEKFRVMKGEEFDAEASMGKVLESYSALEKRVGSGDVPPKSAEEYTITVPENLKEHWGEANEAEFADFKKDALAAGMTQKHFDMVVSRYLAAGPKLMEGFLQNTSEATRGNLEKAWGTGADYEKNFDLAQKAFDAYADPADKGKFDDIMRNPALAYQLLAKIGGELGEGDPVPRDTSGKSGDDEDAIKQLTLSEAATNPKHPEHKAVRKRLDDYYAKKYGTAAVT